MQIGPYEVLGEIGRGGTGTVYRVRGPGGGEAALKLLSQADPAAFARFDRERRLLASLGEAEGFVGLLDAGSSAGGAWLVMPLVGGGTLRDRLEKGPLGVAETRALGVQLARALGAAHARGVVHRDVKPENILFTGGPGAEPPNERWPGPQGSGPARPLIADLGLAKHFDRHAPGASQSMSQTAHGAFKGTAGYVAPEQFADARAAGPAADVFALGAVLYECLAGRPVVEGDSVIEVLAKLDSEKVAPLGRADVPGWLEAVIARALARDPRARFPDGASLAEALARGAPTVPRRALAGPVVLGAAGGAVLVAVAIGLVHSRRDAAPARRDPPTATKLVAAADEKVRARDLDGAIALATRAIELEPELPGSWSVRGTARFYRGDFDAAISDCTRALALDPKLVQAWTNRGAARFQSGDLDGAIADSTRAIELEPSLAQAWLNRSVSLCRKHELERAIADATRAIELSPGWGQAWDTRGAARCNKGDLDGAIEDSTRAIEVEPALAQAWANRAVARSRKDDVDGTIADATRAIELDSRNLGNWTTRGQARIRKGAYAEAVADFAQAIELAPGSAAAWAGRGQARFNQADYAGTLSDCGRAIELDPDYAPARFGRGVALYSTGDYRGAIPELERHLELDPDGVDSAQARHLLEDARKRAP